jgi:hypothetical protein
MIGKVTLGKGFAGAVRYVMEKPNAEVLFMSGISGDNPNMIARQFIAIADEKRDISKPVWHTPISFAYEDQVTNNLMISIAQDYLREIGFDLNQHQYLIVKHNDTKHQHFHILANRIGYDKKVVNDYYCKNRTAAVCDLLEQKYNLSVARNHISTRSRNNKIPPNDYYRREISGYIQSALIEDRVTSFDQLSENLAKHNIQMVLHKQSTGRIYGISFQMEQYCYKGSSIGKDYNIKQIHKSLSENSQHAGELSITIDNSKEKNNPAVPQDETSSNSSFYYHSPIFSALSSKDESEDEKKKKKHKNKKPIIDENNLQL